MAAAGEDAELELEVAAILCDFKKTLRARDRRRRRRLLREKAAMVIPSWGRRRLRSVLDVGKPSAAERDGAASPDTPLAFPDSIVPEEEEEEDKKARAQAEWVQQQRVVVASLSRENADLLKQIEEYRARLLSSRSANESLKQLHKVRRQRHEELAPRNSTTAAPNARHPSFALHHLTTMVPNPRHPSAPPPVPNPLGLDLNDEPVDEAKAAQERYWQAQKSAATAVARRRRLEILRAKVASCRTRRVVG